MQPVVPRVTKYMEVMTEYDQKPGVWGTGRSLQLADLTEAVKQRDHDAVRDYLETHTGPEKQDYVVPLTTACMLGDTEMLKLFISHGVDVSKIFRPIPNYSHTPVVFWPLIQASRSGSAEMVQCLLQEGCAVDVWDQNGDTALMHACEKGHVAVAHVLIKSGADVNHQNIEYASPLVQATTCTEPELIRLILEAGSDPMVLCGVCLQNCITNSNPEGVGLLYTGHNDCVDDDGLKARLRLLTSRKKLTNVNISRLCSNYSSIPALHFACGMDKADSWKTVEVILKFGGVDVSIVDDAGFNCLQYACACVNVRTIHILLANGVYPERDGWRSLWTVFPSLSRDLEPDYLTSLKLLVMAGFIMDEESVRVFREAVEECDLSDKGKIKLSAFIHECSSAPLRLTALCRIKIRQSIPVNIDLNIDRLDNRLPAAFRNYLRFSDVFEAS
ncbi:serine/threonine-protein phosphatase 6 regulatory ankyrin repeat subunit C-like isoform X1 [Haliotis asinina]|uniref:serine/threonine-protein phosphatase 6 regulatory ankyrin repeat subunit C-like isoform X1 n=1 Tax=Haliotis asinina TaxID=109174 RepID=UPI0035319C77